MERKLARVARKILRARLEHTRAILLSDYNVWESKWFTRL